MPRRRKLLIALLAVTSVGGGYWWWTQPRIDPLLVGTWVDPNPTEGSTRFELTLKSDGQWERMAFPHWSTTTQGSILIEGDMQLWEVHNGVLLLNSSDILFLRGGTFAQRWEFTSQRLMNRLSGVPRADWTERYLIQDLGNGNQMLQRMSTSDFRKGNSGYDPLNSVFDVSQMSGQLVRREGSRQ